MAASYLGPCLALLVLLVVICAVTTSEVSQHQQSLEDASDPVLELRKYVERLERNLDNLENTVNKQHRQIVEMKRRFEAEMKKEREDFHMELKTLGELTGTCCDELRTLLVDHHHGAKQSQGDDLEEQLSTDINDSPLRSPTPTDKGFVKRSDDIGALEPVIGHMTQQLTNMAAQIEALQNQGEALKERDQTLTSAVSAQEEARGTTYVRWGHAACPNNTDTVHSSQIGGSWYSHPGAAVNYLCLSPQPVMSSRPLPSNHAFLYGTEYDMNSEHDNGENAVCSVCRIPRASTLMIPGTDTCTPGWTLEYWGYLMTGVPSYTAASEYICVDSSMSVYPGAQADDNGKLLVLTVSQCGSLPCPPYTNNKVVLCAVCSR